MQEVFDEDELPPVEPRRDTELTLGPMLLLGLFFGLLLLCGLCFGLGYSMGSRSAQGASTAGQSGAGSSPAAGSLLKPSAVAQNIPQPPHPASTDLLASENAGASSGANSQIPGATTAAEAGANQPAVKPALPAAATTPAPASAAAQPGSALTDPAGKAASVPPGTLMVQIASVSHQEDADVLVGALRKRGYTVTVRRDSVDNQLHVQIGPFANRNEANAMRQKLLNDGYNAIVQP